MKRTPLRRSFRQIARRVPLQARQRAGWQQSRRAVRTRAHGDCEARIPGVCTGRGSHAHHVLMRSHGGGDELSNLLWVCSADHQYIHEHPAESYQRGWLRKREAAA